MQKRPTKTTDDADPVVKRAGKSLRQLLRHMLHQQVLARMAWLRSSYRPPRKPVPDDVQREVFLECVLKRTHRARRNLRNAERGGFYTATA